MHSSAYRLRALIPSTATPTYLGPHPLAHSPPSAPLSAAEASTAAAVLPRRGGTPASRLHARTQTPAASTAVAIGVTICRTDCSPASPAGASWSLTVTAAAPCRRAVRAHAVASHRRLASAAGVTDDVAALLTPGGQDLAEAAAAADGVEAAAAASRRRMTPGRSRLAREVTPEPQSEARRRPSTASTAAGPSPPAAAAAAGSQQLLDLASLKVSELQTALRSLGLKSSARKKADLIELLLEAHGGDAEATASAVQNAVAEPQPQPADGAATTATAAAPRRIRARTAGVEEGDAAGRDAAAGAVGAVPAAAARRRAIVRQKTAVAVEPDVGAEEEAAAARPKKGAHPDPFLDELFAAMDLDISVTMQDPRAIRAPAATSTTASASASAKAGGVGVAAKPVAEASLRRRRSVESMDTDSDLDSASDLGPVASLRNEDEGAPPPRRRTASAATAVTGSAAAPEEGVVRRRASRGADAGSGPSAGAETSSEGAASLSAAAEPGSASASPDSDLDLEQEYDLPPWPPMFLGDMRTVDQLAPGDREAQEELLLGNVPGMSLTVLGSAAVRATATRALASLAMGRVKDIFIFDAGDDTQRQVAHAYHVKPSKIFRIFLTSLEAECVLGLPGLMCIINSSRERGHEAADIPVHVYGPAGTADFLGAMMRVSHTCLDVTIMVHEISTGPVATGESEPYLYVKRARIWRVAMPPDQLNPRGGVDASLLLFAPDQGRSQRKRGRNAPGGVLSFDTRAGFLPFPPLEPGNPYRRDVLDPHSLTWTLELDITARVIISLLPGTHGPVLSYSVLEADRAGALVMERATAAGLVAGRDIARLKAGEPVTNSWGHQVHPSLVVSPNRPGRRMVVLGNTADPSLLTPQSHPHMAGADVLVAGAVWPQDEADLAAAASGCTTDALGRVARRLGVRYVLLSRFDGSRLDEQEGYAERVAAEVAAAAAAATPRGAARKSKMQNGDGQRLVAEWRRRVLSLDDLESAIVDKNEGPRERELEGTAALAAA